MSYKIAKLNVLLLPSGTTVYATGATFLADRSFSDKGPGQDGSLFVAANTKDIRWVGGDFQGSRDTWCGCTNIRALSFSGTTSNLRVEHATFHDFTAPAIYVDGKSNANPAMNIRISDSLFSRNSAYYYDYQEKPPGGPIEGSTYDDQGQVLMKRVVGFSLVGDTFTSSLGDGLYVQMCRNGTLSGLSIVNNKMGGLHILDCKNVTTQDSKIQGNGSRNVTIEFGSEKINLLRNAISDGGREGLWGSGFFDGLIEDNTFSNNGTRRHLTLTSNIFVDSAVAVPGYPSSARAPTAGDMIIIRGNTFHTRGDQAYAIRIGSGLPPVDVYNNIFQGANHEVLPDPWITGHGSVHLASNSGWLTQNSGTYDGLGNGMKADFVFPHGLNIPVIKDPRVTQHFKVVASVTNTASLPSFTESSDLVNITLHFSSPPSRPFSVSWSAEVQCACGPRLPTDAP